MNTTTQTIIGAVVSAIVALVIVFMFGNTGGSSSLGAASRAYDVDVSFKSLTLATSSAAASRDGSNATINWMSEGSCNLSQSTAGSHAATTSKEYFCAYTGARAGDTVIAELPPGAGAYTSGASSIFGGFVINSAYATTSNVIGLTMMNNTGAATSSFAQATTTVRLHILR